MSAHVLIVEDEDDFIAAIRSVLEALAFAHKISIAKSRDAAFGLLDREFFDIIILDLNIPTADGLLNNDPQHGFAVFGRVQKVASGTPIFVLTGSSAENFIPTLLKHARQLDIWGEGRNVGTINFLPKYMLDQFPENLRPSIAAINALADVEQDRDNVELSITDDRLIRIFSRKFGGARVIVSALGSGLSGAKVLRLRVTDAHGKLVHDAVAKIGTLAIVNDEGARFDKLVSRLEANVTPRKLATLEVGAGGAVGVFYGLAAGFENTAFQAAVSEDAYAKLVVTNIEAGLNRWSDGAHESQCCIKDVRRKLLIDDKLLLVTANYGIDWAADFESRKIQSKWCCVHGDLHGENVLVGSDGTAVIIDYGEVGEGAASLDPITLELSLLFHPKSPFSAGGYGFSSWPTESQARAWGNLEQYVQGCQAETFIRECRSWACRVAAGKREVAATAYAYLMRQLKYEDTNKDLVLALLAGVRAFYDAT